MISFTIITGTPGQLAAKLEQQGIIHKDAEGKWVGTNPGTEWVEVPNPIKVSGSGTPEDPYVTGSQHVYLVKMAHEAEAAQEDEPRTEQTGVDEFGNPIIVQRPLEDWTKFGKYIKNNSAPFTFTSADGRTWQGRKINGEQVWLVKSDDFGVWQ